MPVLVETKVSLHSMKDAVGCIMRRLFPIDTKKGSLVARGYPSSAINTVYRVVVSPKTSDQDPLYESGPAITALVESNYNGRTFTITIEFMNEEGVENAVWDLAREIEEMLCQNISTIWKDAVEFKQVELVKIL
jgi:hypothetical protein